MTPDDLDRFETLAAAATPGPWTANDWNNATWVRGQICSKPVPVAGALTQEDHAFIAAARDAVPALIAQVRAAEERARRLLEALATMTDIHAWDCAESKMGNGNGPCDCPNRGAVAALAEDGKGLER